MDPSQKRYIAASSSHHMLEDAEKQLLKIEDSFIAQFPMPATGSSRQERESEQVNRLLQNTLTNAQESDVVDGSSLSLQQITSVIRVNSLLGKVEEAQAAYDLIRDEMKGEPDTVAINTLMDAYARVGDFRNAARIFKEFHNAEANGTAKPDLISYSILIKACVYAKKLRSAFDVYEAMKAKGMNPSLQIYTTLIKGCIDTRDIPRAWKTFNHMYEEICQPDVMTYSLMIHACALDSNAEKALELFRQMHERGLVATEVTYTSLLQACGSRKDYYGEVWGLVGQMVEQGWKVNLVACKVLMKVCAAQGDLGRLRTVWNWVIAQAANGDPSMQPDAALYRSMFHALGQCVRVSRRSSRGTKVLAKPEPSPYADVDEDVTPSGEAKNSSSESSDSSFDAGSTSSLTMGRKIPEYTFVETVTPTHALQHIHLGSIETSPHSIMTDAATIWNHALESLDEEAKSSELVDSYLSIYCAAPGNIVAASKALQIYDTMYKKVEPTVSVSETTEKVDAVENGSESIASTESVEAAHDATSKSVSDSKADSENSSESGLVPATGWTYQFLLDVVTKDKKLMRERGKDIWRDYLAWDAEKEKALVGLTPTEKESVRVTEGRGRETFKKGFILMARGYAKVGEITPALDTIEAATIFRDDPSYLPAIVFNDVSSLVERVANLAEEGNLVPAKRLKELCPPPPPKSAQEEARQMLKNKWTGGKNWWGWESLGIDENIRRKMLHKQWKENERAKAYWANRRKK
ncbi:hypothetical protein HDU79_011801 [Rhizoclosmatium sp. JEL0117]|nr:hypothetical protein HDU79_011801 [Rhizoclosmatium sp. JEL0117]